MCEQGPLQPSNPVVRLTPHPPPLPPWCPCLCAVACTRELLQLHAAKAALCPFCRGPIMGLSPVLTPLGV